MSNWPSQFNNFLHSSWVLIFAYIFCTVVAERVLKFVIHRFISSKMEKFSDQAVGQRPYNRFSKSSSLAIFSGLWLLGLPLAELTPDMHEALWRGLIIVFTISTVIASMFLVDLVSSYFKSLAEKSSNKFDDLLVPLVGKSAKVFVLSIGAIFIAQSFTLNVTNLIAGLGIGGLAFALAAKDTLSNLFGSLTVLIDRPFHIGDWIVIGDKIEGIVEQVGFRSTRLRTFYDSLITVPNNNLTNIQIDNYGRRRYRRYSTKLTIQYGTEPEVIETFCEGIRQLISNHPKTRKDYFHVYLNDLGSSAYEILLYLFWEAPDWPSELHERHHLLIDVIRLAKQLHVNFAFPTQTLHLFQETKEVVPAFTSSIHEKAVQLGKELSLNNVGLTGPRSSQEQIFSK